MTQKGGCRFLKSRTPQLKPLKIENENVFLKICMIYHNNYYQHIWKWDFSIFNPPYWGYSSNILFLVSQYIENYEFYMKYQPSGKGGTLSLPAKLHHLQHHRSAKRTSKKEEKTNVAKFIHIFVCSSFLYDKNCRFKKTTLNMKMTSKIKMNPKMKIP